MAALYYSQREGGDISDVFHQKWGGEACCGSCDWAGWAQGSGGSHNREHQRYCSGGGQLP